MAKFSYRFSRGDPLIEKIVITGGAGLIGSHLSRELLDDGNQVMAVDDLSQGKVDNLKDLMEHKDFSFVQSNILDNQNLEECCSGASTIFHLAALKIPRYRGYLKTLEVNAKGTQIVLDCARKIGARVIFASTDDVYGKNPDSLVSEESSLVMGDSQITRWSSAASKIYGEHLCFGYAEKYQVPITIIRYSGVFGSTFQLSSLSGVQDLLIVSALTQRALPIHGDGTQTRPFTFIEDAIDATLRIWRTASTDGEIVNIGTGTHISIINLAYLIWRFVGINENIQLNFIPYTDFSHLYEDPRHRKIDISKAKYLFGYQPKISLENGMQMQVEWFKNNLKKIQKLNPSFSTN